MQDKLLILLAGGSNELEQLGIRLQEFDCAVIVTADPNQASRLCRKRRADLVVLAAGGDRDELLEVVESLSLDDHPYEPVIILLEHEDDQSLRSAFLAAGGTDFISGSCDPLVMRTRMESYLRLAESHRDRRDYRNQLDYQKGVLEFEKTVAKSVFNAVLHGDALEGMDNLRWSLSPNALFDGDLILAANSPDGKCHLLVGHFPSHGLAAATGALPTSEIFYTMTAKGFELVEILLEINKRLARLLPTEIYLSACLVEIDAEQRTAHVWNGGMPGPLLYKAGSGELVGMDSRHLPLSVQDNDELDRSMVMVTLDQDDRLFIYANSLLKAMEPSDGEGSAGSLADVLRPDLPQSLGRLDHYLDNGAETEAEDAALLEIKVDQSIRKWGDGSDKILYGHGNRAEWRYQIIMDPETLRMFDPRPMLTQLLVEVQGLQDHRERLYTIIAELFSNALEHGVLELDSALKSSPEGFARYYMEREQRLVELEKGQVRFCLEHQPDERGGILSIEVEDSGSGFDFESNDYGQLKSEGYCGRGIGLIQQMAEQMVYFSPGNKVKISYHWSKS